MHLIYSTIEKLVDILDLGRNKTSKQDILFCKSRSLVSGGFKEVIKSARNKTPYSSKSRRLLVGFQNFIFSEARRLV